MNSLEVYGDGLSVWLAD